MLQVLAFGGELLGAAEGLLRDGGIIGDKQLLQVVDHHLLHACNARQVVDICVWRRRR